MRVDYWTTIGTLLHAIRIGSGLPLPLVVQLQTDPSILRREWRALDLTTVQLACVLLLWVDPAELVRRMKGAAVTLDGERQIHGYDWPSFKNDPYGIGQVELLTAWDWPAKDRDPSADKLRKAVTADIRNNTPRRFFSEAEVAVRISISHMMGRTEQLDPLAIRIRDILLEDEPPSVRDIVVASLRWR